MHLHFGLGFVHNDIMYHILRLYLPKFKMNKVFLLYPDMQNLKTKRGVLSLNMTVCVIQFNAQ